MQNKGILSRKSFACMNPNKFISNKWVRLSAGRNQNLALCLALSEITWGKPGVLLKQGVKGRF